ncbi:hypothetical protein H5410_002049 [Solanum commersonii]|uniref:Ubiquitin-like protease family profile domain-containing protein n=1 Tax=Solanum commersonii TaxID=4109 RepID=A0A9J6B0Z2_SOLCO|nr:hypothetical protein H5410_002049 [Solanum commersonii]
MDHPSFNIGISQLITPNNEQIFESEHPNLNEQSSKSLHATTLMANRTSSKRKSKTKVGSSSKEKDAKTKKKRGRKVAPSIFRPTLPMNMKYVIKHIPKQPLKFGPTYNFNFKENLELSIKDEEVEHDNLDKEIHILHAKGNVLQFSIREFAIITGLKCTENVKDFTYPISKISRLVQRYFPGPNYNINKGRLIDRFELEDFFMIEDGSYKQFSWGQLAFTKLMKSFRKEYKPDKQMYRLNGFPYALNIWITVREGNGIPRVCNWKVVGAKPKYEMFMENIFTEPTQEELESLDLPNNSHVPPNQRATSVTNQEEVQPDDVSDFEEFSSKPPEQLLRRCTHVSTTGSTPPPKRRKVDQKIGALEALIIKNHSELMKAVAAKDNKSDKDIGGISMPHIVDDSVDKGNVDLESASNQLFQQPISPIHMDFATVDHDGDASAVEVEQRLVNEENVAKIEEPSIKDFATVDHDVDANDVEIDETSIKDQTMEDSTNAIPTIHHIDFSIEEFVHNKEVDDAVHKATQLHTKVLSCDKLVADSIKQDSKRHASIPVIVDTSDSSKVTSISSGTETVIVAIVYRLPNEPINVAPLSVIIPPQLTNNDNFLSDSQLPTQLPIKESAHSIDTKTLAPCNRIPSKILQSPYVNTFGSSNKGKGKIDDEILPYTPFEGCGITYQVSSLLMQEYSQWIQKGLLKIHAKNHVDDTLGTQQHIARADVVSLYERSIKDVLAVIVLRNRLIRVYDSSLGTRNKSQSDEIKQLSIILPNYLHDSGFFDKIDRIDWATLDAYKDNKTGELIGPQHPFEVEFARCIMQQNSDRLDCGTYVASFAKFLSDEIKVPSIPFQSEYLRSRYVTLLWKYGTNKANAGYVSENDDPIRLKAASILLADDELFNVE